MKTNLILAVLLITMPFAASAQNYTSAASGMWTTASNWNNTSGWGTSTPPVDGSQGSGTINVSQDMNINGGYNTGSADLNISSGKTLTINGNMTVGGGSAVNVYGNLTINGDLVLNSNLNIHPGGVVTVNGGLIVNSSHYLNVGTNVSPPPYADLIVKNDLKQVSSGDVTLNKNARVAVFGNVTDDGGGGTYLKLNQGAQMYVDGKIGYTGGGNDVINNNTTNPYGLYVNNGVTNSGGGATTTSNKANRATMQTTNISFSNWVNTVSGSLMPVSLLFFQIGGVTQETVVLQWATASEENFDYFIVEASADGIGFKEIGRVKGNGTTTVRHDYTFDAVNPPSGKTYYKLTSVDYDGYTEAFKVISVVNDNVKSVKIFPNPVVDSKLNVNFNFEPSAEIAIIINDLNGIEVTRLSINGMENLLMLSLDAGTYLVRVQSAEVNSVFRLQVL